MTDEEHQEISILLWDGVLGPNNCGGYNTAVDIDILAVLSELYAARKSGDAMFVDDLASKLGMSQTHVELIQYMLCSQDLASYGTSPRGCWLEQKGIDLYERVMRYHLELIG